MTFTEHPPASDDEREALEFLKTGRKLHGLSLRQFQRVEHRLASPNRPTRRKSLLPVLAALCVVFLAGAAVAHVVDFSRLPFVGFLFPAQRPSPAPKAPRLRPHPATVPPSHPDIPITPVPATPPAAEHARALKRTPPLERAEKPQASSSAPLPAAAARAARSDSGRSMSLASRERAIEAKGHEAVREMAVPRTPAPSTPAPTTPAPMAPPTAPTRPAPVLTIPVSRAPEPSTPSAVEDPILAESRSLSTALAQWHRDHNPEAALAGLDLHERKFPLGQIRLEAKLLRVEILLQQDQGREALSLLDSVLLSGLPRGRELHTVRGELRVKYGRCTEGRRDLEHVLLRDRDDALGRRAARALSLCP